jgi:hypothetical protein
VLYEISKESLPKNQQKTLPTKNGFFQTDKFFQDVASDMGLIPNKSET